MGHLYPNCIFTGPVAETVPQWFRFSCAPELTRKGIALPLDDYGYRRRLLALRAAAVTCATTLTVNVPALDKRRPLYSAFWLSRELCF